MGATKLEGANGSVTLVSNNPTDNYILTAPHANGTMALTSDVIGVGQTWQDVTASRALGVTYTNSTGKPLQVSFRGAEATLGYFNIGALSFNFSANYGNYAMQTCYFIVPDGVTYSISGSFAGLGTQWFELR